MSAVLNAALDYARRGWPVFPCNVLKRPMTAHGFHDATLDEAQIRAWCWNEALVAVATGKRSGLVVLDIDIREKGSGLDSLEMLGINFQPKTPTAHTTSGGIHCFFAWPGYEVRNSASTIGLYLDVRGDGGYVVLPPGPGRFWDPHLGLDTPLAPMPEWMLPKESEQPQMAPRELARPVGRLSRYCEAALRGAYKRIVRAPNGAQEGTLNSEAYCLGTLVAGEGMPPALAIQVLERAAADMPNYDRSRPWTAKDLQRKVTDAFTAGLRHPKERRHG
jgi:putative DNA primase/helicase